MNVVLFIYQSEKEQMATYKAILDNFRANEINNPALIDKAVIERVATAAKTTPQVIRQFLLMADRMRLLYEYAHILHNAGEPMPESEDEFVRKQTSDPRFQKIAIKT